MKSSAKTIEDYLNELPPDRKEAVATVRLVVLNHLPKGYEEVMNWGMITYQVPLTAYPDTYNGKPLMYAALANQKNHMAIYLCGLYCISGLKERFQKAFEATGKKLNMGASCIRFKKLDDLPFDLIGNTIATVDMETFVTAAKNVHRRNRNRKAPKR